MAATFWILVVVAIVSALGTVIFKNIIYSAFSLVLTFVTLAGIYMFLQADFVAMAQILIYAGAISILLVFGIMLSRSKPEMKDSNPFSRYKWSGGLVALLFFATVSGLVLKMRWLTAPLSKDMVQSTVGPIAESFLTTYAVPMEIAAILLLVAMVGAIILAREVKD